MSHWERFLSKIKDSRFLVDGTNIMSHSTSESSSKGGAPIGLINSLAGGGGAAAGAGGHSTLSRKSGTKKNFEKKNIFPC